MVLPILAGILNFQQFRKLILPGTPVWLACPFVWWFATLFMFFMLLVTVDFAHLAIWLAGKLGGYVCCRRYFWLFAKAVCLFAAASVAAWKTGVRDEAVLFREEIALPGLPPEASGFKIALISDLHVGQLADREMLDALVVKINALHADLIAVTGDFADGTVAELKDKLDALAALHAPCGVYAVPGNHEYYYEYRVMMDYLRSIGFTVLENHGVALPEYRIFLGGTTDPAAEFKPGITSLPDASAALAAAPPGYCKILLAHQPKVVDRYGPTGADLQLSGHTHGGMIPGLNLIVKFFNRGYCAGLRNDGVNTVYVNRGTGIWAGFPIRIGIPPEYTLITLKPLNDKYK